MADVGAAVWLRFRSEARRRWRAWLAMGLLAGCSTGVVVAALAGAARTDGAYDDFLERTEAFDVVIQGSNNVRDFSAIARLPQVQESALASYVPFGDVADPAGQVDALDPLAPHDGGLFESFHRPRLLEGRRPSPSDPEEIAITPTVAREQDLSPGDVLNVRAFAPDQLDVIFQGEAVEPAGPEFELRIVGIEIAPSEFLDSGNAHAVHMSPAFHAAYRDEVLSVPALAVRLERGERDIAAFKRDVERSRPDLAAQYITQAADADRVNETLDLQANALRVFAAVAAGAAALVIGQALARQGGINASEDAVLAALGMGRRHVLTLVLLRSAVVAAIAGLAAFVVGVTVAPRLSFGLARHALFDSGVSLDGDVVAWVAIATVGVVILGVLGGVASALRGARRSGGDGRPSRVATAAVAARLPPPAVAGVRFALEPGSPGVDAVPVRSAVAGTVVAVAALTMAVVFGASLDHLFSTPRLYGWNWDVVYGNAYTEDVADDLGPVLDGADEVVAWSSIGFSQVEVSGIRTQGLGFEPGRGSVLPPLIEGREPATRSEVVLGTRTMRDADVGIGDTVTLAVGSRSLEFDVVGRAVLPSLGQFDVAGLGEGALLSLEGLRELVPDVPRNLFAVRVRDGSDRQAAVASLNREVPAVVTDASEAPKEIADFGRVDAMPSLLALLLGVVGVATLIHLVAVVVRRRRRETAVLKTLGLVRRQVGEVVAWQATTLAAIGVLVGVPLGIVAGRAVWSAFADGLGVVPEPSVPIVVLAVITLATLLVANLAALVPARMASTTPAAIALRAE